MKTVFGTQDVFFRSISIQNHIQLKTRIAEAIEHNRSAMLIRDQTDTHIADSIMMRQRNQPKMVFVTLWISMLLMVRIVTMHNLLLVRILKQQMHAIESTYQVRITTSVGGYLDQN